MYRINKKQQEVLFLVHVQDRREACVLVPLSLSSTMLRRARETRWHAQRSSCQRSSCQDSWYFTAGTCRSVISTANGVLVLTRFVPKGLEAGETCIAYSRQSVVSHPVFLLHLQRHLRGISRATVKTQLCR